MSSKIEKLITTTPHSVILHNHILTEVAQKIHNFASLFDILPDIYFSGDCLRSNQPEYIFDIPNPIRVIALSETSFTLGIGEKGWKMFALATGKNYFELVQPGKLPSLINMSVGRATYEVNEANQTLYRYIDEIVPTPRNTVPREHQHKIQQAVINLKSLEIALQIAQDRLATSSINEFNDLETNLNFWPLVKKTLHCWLWQGKLDEKGYGIYNGVLHQKYERKAYRIAYALVYGPIPEGLVVRHRCANPACVNPYHLILGEPWENNLDIHARRRYQEMHSTETTEPSFLYTYEDGIDYYMGVFLNRIRTTSGDEQAKLVRQFAIMSRKKDAKEIPSRRSGYHDIIKPHH